MAIFQGNLSIYSSSLLAGKSPGRGNINIYNTRPISGNSLVFGRMASLNYSILKGVILSPGLHNRCVHLIAYAFAFRAIFGSSSYQTSTHIYIAKQDLLSSYKNFDNKAEALLFGFLMRVISNTGTSHLKGDNYSVYLENETLKKEILIYIRKLTRLGVYTPTQFNPSDF